MYNEEKKIAAKLQKIAENLLTRKIIIPLFESLGYLKVEFFGGVTEEGKDIICWEQDKMGEIKLTVAQVKHFKFSNRASDSRSLQTIINQLVACFTKSLLYIDQSVHFPSEVFLITTHEVETKTLQSRFSSHQNLRDQRIKIIDGIRLASLILQHRPEIVKELIGAEIEISSILKKTLNNEALLAALGFHQKINLKNIYTDIDFSLGKLTTQLFFYSTFNPVTKALGLNADEWEMFKSVIQNITHEFPLHFLDKTIEEIEEEYKFIVNQYSIWKPKFDSLNLKSKKLLTNLDSLIKKRNETEKIKESTLLKIKNKLIENNSSSKHEIIKLQNEIEKIKVSILKIKREIAKKEEESVELLETIDKFKESEPHMFYFFDINGKLLIDLIKKKRKWIEDKVTILNKKAPNTIEIKNFINKCNSIINAAHILFAQPNLLESITSGKNKIIRKNFESTRVKMSIDKIFDTGINIILLGEAGAGKTTSLQMYALNRQYINDRLIIWAPLAQVIQIWHENHPNLSPNYLKANLEEGIAKYLIHKGISISSFEFQKILKSQNVILLLDGIDESIKHNPWLPEGIINTAEKYKKRIQIIVSSRMSGNYLESIPFFAVTLLPFTNEQRDEFIEKWFGESEKDIIENIKKHLKKNDSINEITKNPLLTTTLCVLAKHNLPLPNTEIKLYNDRLRLLTGYYDNVKNIITRISSSPQTLEILAQKLAYFLHSIGQREESISTLHQQAKNLMKNILNENDSMIALNDLIDPCNILVPMNEEGQYGFGHLRYQEHLAAKEIISNRGIQIIPLLEQNWWREVLILFSQMNDNLEWLIHEVKHFEEYTQIKETLSEMIQARPENEKERIKILIETINSEKKQLAKDYDEFDSPQDFF